MANTAGHSLQAYRQTIKQTHTHTHTHTHREREREKADDVDDSCFVGVGGVVVYMQTERKSEVLKCSG